MPKEPRSFSVDKDLDEILSNREDVNASAVVNNFLREFLTNGRGEEAALEVRLSQLDEEIADLEKQLDRKRRERDRVKAQLESRRGDFYDVVEEVILKIDRSEFPVENITADNEAIQSWASEAGVSAEEFVTELRGRVDELDA